MSFGYPISALVIAALLIVRSSFAAESQADSAAIRQLLSDASEAGLPVGADTPDFKLKDQNGHDRDLASLRGPKGLVLVFFRSADW